MKVVDDKKAIQDMADHSQKWHNMMSARTRSTIKSDGLADIQAQLNNLGREIQKDCPLKEEGKTFEEAYYTQFGVPFHQGGRYRAAAPRLYLRDNGNDLYQEQRQTMEESLSKFMVESAKRHDENSNLIKEIQASTDATIRNQGSSIKALEIQIGQMSKLLQERGSRSVPSLTESNPRDHVKSISTIVETDMPLILDFVVLDMPEDIKVPLILGRPFLSTTHTKIDMFKRTISLKVGDDKIVFKNYIELNDLNEPLELRRNQVEDLGPMIEDGEIIDEPMMDIVKTRNDNE
uniref:Reverse transcriptase domain-containing protein n=1 Tax=Tanacetum cinerariifolium TaxID=118510 RepID=A0A699GRH5_TANCI|nr:hypothetical protein [Tanacetum cinerariifolium]